jgi:hypothetical protein
MKVVFTYLFRIPPAWKERIHPLPHPTNNLPAYSRRKEPTKEEPLSFVCTLWVHICLSFNSQQGHPSLASLEAPPLSSPPPPGTQF